MRCRKVRQSMAASLYEKPDADEHDAMQRHLASCTECKAEYEELGRLVSHLPNVTPSLDRNLLPVLRPRLAEKGPGMVVAYRWRLAFAAAAFLLAIGWSIYSVIPQSSSLPVVKRATDATVAASDSEIAPFLAKAESLVANRQYAQAYETLASAVESHPRDPLAGGAQLRLADLAFNYLQLYRQADRAYEKLAREYRDYWDSMAGTAELREVVFRRELLAEAEKSNYEALYALDLARDSASDERFARLEEVIAQYPGTTWIAATAAADMQRFVRERNTAGNETCSPVEALEQARSLCVNPVAAARMNYEIARIYWVDLGDSATARGLLTRVAESPNLELAKLAEDSLKQLDAGEAGDPAPRAGTP